jgi:hypothetical protein
MAIYDTHGIITGEKAKLIAFLLDEYGEDGD